MLTNKVLLAYFCEESKRCFAAKPTSMPMKEPVDTGSAVVSGKPVTNPHITAKITAAAVMFDTLAFENISLPSMISYSFWVVNNVFGELPPDVILYMICHAPVFCRLDRKNVREL